MGKIAFVFSGQGAQYPGMGRELAEISPAAAAVFVAADEVRPGTSMQCFYGDEQDLNKTRNTQPCMYTVEMAAAAALNEAGVEAQAMAGFSLGELSALVCGGSLSFAEGLRLVMRRGALMQEAADRVESAMAAVVGLEAETVERLCAGYSQVYPVNYNCPKQVSVSGHKDEMTGFKQDVKSSGGRALPLRVSGGFHSPFMAPAAQRFARILREVAFQRTAVPVYSDYTAQPYQGDYAWLLERQISNPVRWQAIVEDLAAHGFDTFVELGPGNTLCNLIHKTLSDARTFHVEDAASLSATLKEMRA